MAPALITSAMPFTSSRCGSVASADRSMYTRRGWWNAPMRFLPAGESMPVLPPMEESTQASMEVGTCTTGTPRMYVAATNPARSPTTPPPSATTHVSRWQRCSSIQSSMSALTDRHLDASPAGTTFSSGAAAVPPPPPPSASAKPAMRRSA
jgi:hypothetical protein